MDVCLQLQSKQWDTSTRTSPVRLKSHFLPGDLDLQGRPLTLTRMTFELDPCDP